MSLAVRKGATFAEPVSFSLPNEGTPNTLALIWLRKAPLQKVATFWPRFWYPSSLLPTAQHVAVAAVFAVDYLMTWNCKHIANADRLPLIYSTLRDEGFDPPLIVTPEEFSNDDQAHL